MNLRDLPSIADLPDDGLLTPRETAAYLRVTEEALSSWRARPGKQVGLPFIRLGPSRSSGVRYRVGAVRKWLATQEESNDETPAAA